MIARINESPNCEENLMDPRRRMDEKYDRLRSSQVPFVEKHNEIVFVEQSLGKPAECEVIVIRIHKPLLKLYSFFVVFIVFLGVIMAFQA